MKKRGWIVSVQGDDAGEKITKRSIDRAWPRVSNKLCSCGPGLVYEAEGWECGQERSEHERYRARSLRWLTYRGHVYVNGLTRRGRLGYPLARSTVMRFVGYNPASLIRKSSEMQETTNDEYCHIDTDRFSSLFHYFPSVSSGPWRRHSVQQMFLLRTTASPLKSFRKSQWRVYNECYQGYCCRWLRWWKNKDERDVLNWCCKHVFGKHWYHHSMFEDHLDILDIFLEGEI